jgi:hypothetical protein
MSKLETNKDQLKRKTKTLIVWFNQIKKPINFQLKEKEKKTFW